MLTKLCGALAVLSALGLAGAVMTNGFTQCPFECCPLGTSAPGDSVHNQGGCPYSCPTAKKPCCEDSCPPPCCGTPEIPTPDPLIQVKADDATTGPEAKIEDVNE